MSDFKIQVERLTDTGEGFSFVAQPAWWHAICPEGEGAEKITEEEDRLDSPIGFELTALRTGDKIIIEGQAEGQVGCECSRCGKRYPHPLREAYRLVLDPVDGSESLDPEGQRGLAENGLCLGEELEAGWYRGPILRLDDFFGEVVALAMPIQPVCSEGCPGVCPLCGARKDGDEGSGCRCEEEKIESPFAVLAKLRDSGDLG